MKIPTYQTITTHLLRAALLFLVLACAIQVMPVLAQRLRKKAAPAQPAKLRQATVRLDHFKAYKLPPDLQPLNAHVMLKDQFGPLPQPRIVLNPFRFANPVDKERNNIHTPITNPESHLKLYNLNQITGEPLRSIIVKNQFGPQVLQVQASRLLAVPTSKSDGGQFHNLDHFQCYDCAGQPVNVAVNLIDEFHTENNVGVLQPRFLCNPVEKYFGPVVTGIMHPDDHLVFYAISGQPAFNIALSTSNQFGAESLPVQEADMLGVPSAKVQLDHFKAYKIAGTIVPLNLQVKLRDQFDSATGPPETRTVLNPFRFANPVDKERNNIHTPITNPQSHLKLYTLNPPAGSILRKVVVFNQFGQSTLTVRASSLLAVPTGKNASAFHDLDHFKCYDCGGPEVDIVVNLTDQFHTENNVLVVQPRYFCNPVAKTVSTGTTPILHPVDHLIFYAINPQPAFNTTVNTNNQFGTETNLPLQEADLLGVPSLKLLVLTKAVSRKVPGGAATFDVNLPLDGTPGIECRTGGSTGDFTMVVTFADAVTVTGSPQAAVNAGIGDIGSGGFSNGGVVSVSGSEVTIPLTNVANAQTINVTLNSVNGSSNVVIPMTTLLGDTNGNGAVNASDVSLTKSKVGQAVDATNFRNDVTVNGSINASDVSLVKSKSGTALP